VDVELAKGRVVPIGITHMDLQAAARATQATEIVAELGNAPLAVLMGDLNAEPDAPAVKTLADAFTDAWTAAGTGTGYTIPVNTPGRRIDYVFLGKGWPKPTGASVPMTTASDHLPVVVDVPLPP